MLADIEKHKVTAVVVVPVMLSRMLDALEKMDTKPDLSQLRIVFVSGSQLGAELATRALKELGPVDLQPVRLDGDRVRHHRPAQGSVEEPGDRRARSSRA